MEKLQQYLPSTTVASALVEIYFDHGAWLSAFLLQTMYRFTSLTVPCRYNPISKTRFFEEVYNPVYSSEAGQNSLLAITSHNAALLFIVLTLGSFLSNDNDTDTTEHYHQLARTAMSCDAILVDPTMPAIRTLVSTLLQLRISS